MAATVVTWSDPGSVAWTAGCKVQFLEGLCALRTAAGLQRKLKESSLFISFLFDRRFSSSKAVNVPKLGGF